MNPVNQEDVDNIGPIDLASGTTRCLPDQESIPVEFTRDAYNGTIYNRIIMAWYIGDPPPGAEIRFNPGFREDGPAVKKFIMAHLNSFDPDHFHKIAGCAYLLSKIVTVKEET